VNCPNTKHRKPVRLKRVRTIIEGKTVKRESVCPKCKGRFWTIEMFEENFNDLIRSKDNEAAKLRAERNDAESQVDEIRDCVKTILSLTLDEVPEDK
jgi:transcriptional regulator NrdR family protein